MKKIKLLFQIFGAVLANECAEKALYYSKLRYNNMALIGKAYENTLEFKLFEFSEKMNMAMAEFYIAVFKISK